MIARSKSGIKTVTITLLGLIFFMVPLSGVAEPGTSAESEVGKQLLAVIEAGIPFEGKTTNLDGTAVWPGFLFLKLKNNSLDFHGHIEWTSLNHVNYVEGTITETGDFVEVNFTATKALVKGSASVGANYHAIALLKEGKVRLLGRWSSGEHRGPFDMTVNPAMAGQQSSLLEGKSIDEALTDQAKQEQAGKPQAVWNDECVDWKVAGFQYPNGDRFIRLNCKWARDRLAKGPTPGEMMFIITTADDSPLLGFTYNHMNWKKNLSAVDHINIYFSSDLSYRLPVEPGSGDWAFSTDPAMVRKIIGRAQKDAGYLDSDMIVDTGIKGLLDGTLQANISTKGFDYALKAGRIFMNGEQPPSILELMQRDDR